MAADSLSRRVVAGILGLKPIREANTKEGSQLHVSISAEGSPTVGDSLPRRVLAGLFGVSLQAPTVDVGPRPVGPRRVKHAPEQSIEQTVPSTVLDDQLSARNRLYDIGIVGLGYTGLTLAAVFAEAGKTVMGVDRRPDLVELTNEGIPHFTETGLPDALAGVMRSGRLVAAERFDDSFSCGTYIITVGTPLAPDGAARVDMIEKAARDVAENMRDDALVIVRSAVKVGTTRNVVAPILAASGKRFTIAFCPNRTTEGEALRELRQLPQTIGADDAVTAGRAAAIFGVLTGSAIHVSSPEVAEIIDLIDTGYRDINFAYANEIARLCDAVGVSAYEVINSGRLGHDRLTVPLPGLVGGSSHTTNPYILVESARAYGINVEVTSAGRLVNERQPQEAVDFITSEIERRGLEGPLRINILGMAFKGHPETSDLRGSMSIKVLDALKKAHPSAQIGVYDPVTPREVLAAEFPDELVYGRFGDAISGASVVIFANNHPSFGKVSPRTINEYMSPGGFVYDYWNHFSHLPTSELGDSYFAVGSARSRSR